MIKYKISGETEEEKRKALSLIPLVNVTVSKTYKTAKGWRIYITVKS